MIMVGRFVVIALWLNFAASSTVLAQTGALPLFQETLRQTTTESPAILPEPTALQAGWWQYFQHSDETVVQARIEATLDRLDELVASLPQASRETGRAAVELVRANLLTLPQIRDQTAPQPPAPPAYSREYTIEQMLELSEQLRQVRTNRDIVEPEITAAENAISGVGRRLDNLMAGYLALRPSNPERALQGLEIMAERTSLMVTEERLRINRAELEVLRVRASQLTDELEVARDRLSANWGDLLQIDLDIVDTQADLEAAHGRLVREQSTATQIVGSSPADRATGQYRQQRVIKASIDEAVIRTRLNRLQMQRYLTQLLLDQSVDTLTLRNQQERWLAEHNNLDRQIQIWRNSSERERSRAGLAIASPDEIGTPDYSRLIVLNQDRFRLAQDSLVALERLQGVVQQNRRLLEQIDIELLQLEGWLRSWLAWSQLRFQDVVQGASSWIHTSLFRIGDTPVTAMGLLRVLLIITVAWLFSYLLRRALTRLSERSDSRNLPAFYTVGRLSHYVLVIAGVLMGLSTLGMDFTNFALVAGALALGIGFGLQAIVNNFISGLILLFERSLKVGDFVELGSGIAGEVISGEVKAINVRSTQIKTNENIDIIVPNSAFMTNNVVNWTLQEPYRRVHYPFRVAFGISKELVRKAGLEAAEKVPHTLSGLPGKNPQVWLVGYAENGYSFELVVWLTPSAVKRPQAVQAAFYWELETALQKYQIEVPVPQRDLRLREGLSGWSVTTDTSLPPGAT
jgi:small-conductance mechanosensitive channel